MKKLIQSLSAVAIFAVTAMAVHAQPAPKILVVDMTKLFNSHYKYVDEKAKLEGYGQKAQAELDQMTKDRQALIDQFKGLDDQARSPLSSADAKAKAQADAQAKYNEIQTKTTEMQQFASDTQRSLQSQMQNFHDMLMQDIAGKASDIAKKHGATLLLDKSGVGLGSGTAIVVFADPSYDITDEVAAEIAKDRPPESAAPVGPVPAPSSDQTAPSITVPSVTPPNNG